jgi:anti-anti-sigma regulatory factor
MRSVCLDCAPLEAPTAVTVDQLARLQLAMRRCGCELELSNVEPCLTELIGLFGLADVLRVEAQGQAEQRKDPGGVEEEGQLANPSIR